MSPVEEVAATLENMDGLAPVLPKMQNKQPTAAIPIHTHNNPKITVLEDVVIRKADIPIHTHNEMKRKSQNEKHANLKLLQPKVVSKHWVYVSK